MKLYNLEDNAQKKIFSDNSNEKKGGSDEDKPLFDKSAFAEDWEIQSKSAKSTKKKNLFDVGELQ
jgi:hypothetical protein